MLTALGPLLVSMVIMNVLAICMRDAPLNTSIPLMQKPTFPHGGHSTTAWKRAVRLLIQLLLLAVQKNNGLDWVTITDCSTTTNPAKGSDTDGNPNMHQIAVTTNNLIPPHQWTPWVVVQGTPLTSAEIDAPLTPIVCKQYSTLNSGNSSCVAPAACRAVVLDYKM